MIDEDLLERYVESQDHEAFRVLVGRHAGMVYGVALRRTKEVVLAEEIAQTVFVQLAKKAGSLKEPGRLAGWLHRSALLEAAHQLRKRRRETEHQQRFKEEIESSNTDERPSELALLIDEALGELPPRDRELVLAKFYEGLTYREIAARRTQGEAATRKQGSRALEKLERLLCRKGLAVTSVTLSACLSETLKADCAVGLPEIIEGRVAEMAAGNGVAISGAIGSALGSSLGLALIAAVMAVIPLYQGWGRRIDPTNTTLSGSNEFSILSARKAPVGALTSEIPTIDQILAAQGTARIELLIPWLESAGSEALAEMAEAIKRGSHSYARESSIELFLSLYLQRWLAVDSKAAFAFADDLSRQEGRLIETLKESKLFGWWAQSDPESAWMEARSRSTLLAGKVVARIQEQEPWKAFDLAKSLTPEEASTAISWEKLFSKLADVDVDRALAAAGKIADPLAQSESVKAVVHALAKHDPAAAMEVASAAGESDRLNLMEVALGEWLSQDWPAAWSAVVELTPGMHRVRLTKIAAMLRGEESANDGEIWADTLTDAATKRAAWSGLAIIFSRTDAERARVAFEKLNWDITDIEPRTIYHSSGSSTANSEEDSLADAAKAVAMKLALADHAKAFAFTSLFNNSAGRGFDTSNINYELARSWMAKDPDGMVRYIEQESASQMRSFLIGRYVDQVSDPATALPWAKSLGGEAAGGAILTIFNRLADIDYDLVIDQLPALEDLDLKTQAWIVQSSLRPSRRPKIEQLSRVKDWLDEQTSTPLVANGYNQLINQWAYQNMEAATSMLEQLEPGPVRQGAINGLLGFVGNESPMKHEVVLHWIGQAESEKTQQFWLKILAKDWLAKDPDTAHEVIPKAGLKKDTWEMLLSRQQINEQRGK